jgi:hypothetical protein
MDESEARERVAEAAARLAELAGYADPAAVQEAMRDLQRAWPHLTANWKMFHGKQKRGAREARA